MKLLSFLNVGKAAPVSALSVIEAISITLDGQCTTDEERQQVLFVLDKLRQNPDAFQAELDKIDIVNASVFNAGWRPAIGWICAMSMAVYYIPRFLAGTVFWCFAAWGQTSLPPLPEMGIGDILGLVGSLLGMSWLRTNEKKAGIV